jgi:hypothetical protein
MMRIETTLSEEPASLSVTMIIAVIYLTAFRETRGEVIVRPQADDLGVFGLTLYYDQEIPVS